MHAGGWSKCGGRIKGCGKDSVAQQRGLVSYRRFFRRPTSEDDRLKMASSRVDADGVAFVVQAKEKASGNNDDERSQSRPGQPSGQ